MRQVLAILGDSLREAADRRSLLVLLLAALLPIAFCLGLSFESESLTSVLERQAPDITRFERRSGGMSIGMRHDATEFDFRVLEGPSDSVDWQAMTDAALGLRLTFEGSNALDRLAVEWYRFHRRFGAGDDVEIPRLIDGQPRTHAFLVERFRQFGWNEVAVRRDPGDDRVVHLALAADQPATLQGAHRASLVFGLWKVSMRGMSVATFVILLQHGLATMFVGFIGMLIALSACSAFVPNMLQKGSLDLLLARPVSRTKLLLAKYCGGLWFVFLIACVSIGGCYVALAVNSGYTHPSFLATIPTLTFTFASLYAVAVAVGVRTRSAGLSALIAIAVWGVSNGIKTAHQLVTQTPFGGDGETPAWVATVLDGVYAILPKIKDIDTFNLWIIGHDDLPAAIRRQQLDDRMLEVDAWWSFGTTALFTAGVLALAVWWFRRRDW